MKRRKIAAANWKMNLDLGQSKALSADLLKSCPQNDVAKIICAPFPFLAACTDVIGGRTDFSTAAQDCSMHESGAYTGEVSAAMIRSVGAKYIVIGHSERRTYFNEGSAMLTKKIEQALKYQLDVIYCFGELLSERKAEKHFEIVKNQLTEVLPLLPKEKMQNIILAYEPVWAIGTGETATPVQAQEMHAHVRKVLTGICNPEISATMPVLYGGSCNAANAAELFACPDVDGGLVGGASLKAADFGTITQSFT